MDRILCTLVLLGTAAQVAATPKVLIVSIDGCRADALHMAHMPNVDALIAAGSVSFDARNTMVVGWSGPNHASMLAGVAPAKHGVMSNALGANGFLGNHFDQWPTVFARLEAWNPSLSTSAFVGWAPIALGLRADRDADLVAWNGDDANALAAADLLRTADPDLLFLHLQAVDTTGHQYGFSPDVPEYLGAIESADARLGIVLESLYARTGYADGTEDWLILATTDHGGRGTQHLLPEGGAEVYTTFYIVSGQSVPKGVDLGSPAICDVAVTALNHLGYETAHLRFDGTVVVPEPSIPALLVIAGGLLAARRPRRLTADYQRLA